MAEFVSVMPLDQLPPDTIVQVTVGQTEVAIVNCDGTVYAINDICSHAYAHLGEGELDTDDCTIECPLHGSTFSLRTGKPRTLPATMPVPVYPVQIVDGVIQIGVS